MYKDIIQKQFQLDFHCGKEQLEANFFTTATSTSETRYWARNKGDIICFQNKLFVRTENEQLTLEIEKRFSTMTAEWFLEMDQMHDLGTILKKYNLKIARVAPFFIPEKRIRLEDIDLTVERYNQEDIAQFKGNEQISQAFCYSEQDPDQVGFGYSIDNELIAVCGANKIGQYTWEIGIEILNETYRGQGIATKLVQILIATIQKEHPDILPVYSTSFSHIHSINVAIHAGCKLGWTELIISDL